MKTVKRVMNIRKDYDGQIQKFGQDRGGKDITECYHIFLAVALKVV